MIKNTILNSSALVVAVTAALYSPGARAQTNLSAGAAVAAKPSAGVLNDYLRRESDFFNDWDIGGQVRARLEAHDFFAVAGRANSVDFREHGGVAHNDYLLMREKVHIGYAQPWWGFYVEGRDSSTTGDERNPNPESDAADLQQAYLRFGDPSQFPLSLKIGRQELQYGDERLIGNADWLNIPRTFDAARLRYENPHFWVDAFTSRPILADDNSFNMANEYETFSGLYGSTRELVPKTESQLYFLARNVELKSPFAHVGDFPQAGGASARDIYTVGLRLKSLPNQLYGWDYGLELMGQFGRYKEGGATLATEMSHKNLDQEAFAAYIGGGYTWTNLCGSPRLGLEYNYATGDDNPKDDKHGTFDNLYPTNHKFYGMMDFVSLQNIHNIRFMSSIAPVKNLSLSLQGHLFWLADTHDSFYTVGGARRGGLAPTSGKGYGINAGNDSFVGSEIDLVGTYKICPGAALQAGYGHFFVGDYVEQSLANPLVGSHDADFLYLQMLLTF